MPQWWKRKVRRHRGHGSRAGDPGSYDRRCRIRSGTIADHIAKDNPARAVSFTRELREAALKTGHAPNAYPRRPDFGPGIRIAIRKPYRIIFRVAKTHVEVLRIIHGRRDLTALFARD